jgi:hypothetical protein
MLEEKDNSINEQLVVILSLFDFLKPKSVELIRQEQF